MFQNQVRHFVHERHDFDLFGQIAVSWIGSSYHFRAHSAFETRAAQGIGDLRDNTADVKHGDTIRSGLFEKRLSEGKQDHP